MKYLNLVEKIKSTLDNLQKSEIVVMVLIGRLIMMGLIQQEHLAKFKCSEHFVHDFFQLIMNWTPHQGTWAAAHLPDDADIICKIFAASQQSPTQLHGSKPADGNSKFSRPHESTISPYPDTYVYNDSATTFMKRNPKRREDAADEQQSSVPQAHDVLAAPNGPSTQLESASQEEL
ncbi:hypothetical protein Moror_8457 [Moniliophthora roreri MCA 2997]|uniref:Uncharacterized protein n=1 Tax=Moniliophthora roreri (strain MCA 2997) TaxID=1381753 RepID=V2W570_MONRO|nr:hypothetical protein Moror_8457 [Moniliophthora roreri MCA 2997]